MATWIFFTFSNVAIDGVTEAICDALVQFGCYHHIDVEGYACRVLAIASRVWELPSVRQHCPRIPVLTYIS